jgi:mitochondrial-processing peptidase subunit alpha
MIFFSYHWMYNSTAYNHSYADAGLFCIRASGPPEKINEMAKIILKQFFLLTEGVDKAELERAKTQLKSQLMMNLEMRPVMFEDLVRQIIAHGIRKKPEEYVELISKFY